MKNTIFYIAILLCLFFVASCHKENDTLEQNASQFTATIESCENTKTIVEISSGTYITKWETGDQIKVNGVTYDATPDPQDATKAVFKLSKSQSAAPISNLEPPYKAYFPASIYDGSTAVLPGSYTYANGKYNMPMYAESQTQSLSFNNLCGVFRLSLVGDEKVKTITITANENICGPFTIGEVDGKYHAVINNDNNPSYKTITINCGEDGVQLSDTPTEFFIPLPKGTYTKGMKITVAGDGTEALSYTKTTNSDVAVERNTVYPFVWTVKYLYKVVLWANEKTNPEFLTWGQGYRYALSGHEYECDGVFNESEWNQIKNGTFYLLAKHNNSPEVKVTTGWWSLTWPKADFNYNLQNGLVNNGDGTCCLEITFGYHDIVGLLDNQNLLFAGAGYYPMQLYYYFYKNSSKPGGTQPYTDNDNPDWF